MKNLWIIPNAILAVAFYTSILLVFVVVSLDMELTIASIKKFTMAFAVGFGIWVICGFMWALKNSQNELQEV